MTVLGGAMLPHAPQFFTMPPTEDRENVELLGCEIESHHQDQALQVTQRWSHSPLWVHRMGRDQLPVGTGTTLQTSRIT